MVARAGCMVAPGGGGHAWLLWQACVVVPVVHVWLLWGVCMVAPGGHVWLLWGAHAWLLLGGMHGCSRGGACVGYDEIRRYDQ